MRKLTFVLCALGTFATLCYAGPEQYSAKDKEVILPEPPPCEWYRAHEWNFDIWGAYAFAPDRERRPVDFDFEAVDEEFDETGEAVFLGEPVNDRFLHSDHAWGGGGDVKYFWSRYFGIGLEAFLLDTQSTAFLRSDTLISRTTDHHLGGAVLATLTFRYPIGCSRFAPYAFAGVGALVGGSRTDRIFFEVGDEADEIEYIADRSTGTDEVRVIGQLGAGLEMRFNRPSSAKSLAVGMMGDFTWNFIGGGNDQDFGMARVGLNFSY